MRVKIKYGYKKRIPNKQIKSASKFSGSSAKSQEIDGKLFEA